VVQVVQEGLPSICEALGSIPNTVKKDYLLFGDTRGWTPGLMLAGQVVSHLSDLPALKKIYFFKNIWKTTKVG
jgi:hypothetical protein